ncbi:uncharacterized protein Z518_00730 [Rhinocladiella mackenziei CBS 650.93]|uniref:FAD linked oxidase N-terminal domain-containing protein n=1 Tax=Rhinocladiella mackenziei CBS 650.93 TaxID=1442369 RepID=A0A0D2IUB4_9EURO|nr:uncharacterized protein Z518_00730 [Rhinocladiella mackenziei CBS 650.93]KIX09649.1 hypothetical protein Z518_00730 [Rhinocladiella mackenziei CBS 650.93]
MNHFSFNVEAQTAEVQPATYGSNLNKILEKHDLLFPGGHCPTVGLGGFLLQGGFGWNSRKWGVACESILAIDVVTADGDLIHVKSAIYDQKEAPNKATSKCQQGGMGKPDLNHLFTDNLISFIAEMLYTSLMNESFILQSLEKASNRCLILMVWFPLSYKVVVLS